MGSGRTPFFIVIIILLLLINGALFYFNMQEKDKVVEVNKEKKELSIQFTELKEDFATKRDSLVVLQEDYRTTTEEKEKLQAEINKLDEYVSSLKGKNALSKKQLAEARSQLDHLSGIIRESNKQIGLLKDANVRLSNDLETERVKTTELSKNIEEKQEVIANLETEKAEVIDRNTTLGEEKDNLQARLEKASIIMAGDTYLKPFKYGRKNKRVDTSKARKTDAMEACFEVIPNSEAQIGPQEFTLILTNPKGKVFPVEQNGEGNFTTNEGEKRRYTAVLEARYEGRKNTFCSVFTEPDFISGTYHLEVFNRATSVGTGKVTLK